MVAQVMCLVCSISPEPQTTEITFHKFPNAIEASDIFAEWKKALCGAIPVDSNMSDSYICSRHFKVDDFAFVHGKLILLKNAIPSRILKDDYDNASKDRNNYEPTAHSNNFATTLSKDNMTTSLKHLRSDMVCTETSRVLTPTVTEYITKQASLDGKLVDSVAQEILQATRKRNADLEIKIREFHKIFKRLRNDNLLTEIYVNQLEVCARRTILLSANLFFFVDFCLFLF